MEQFKGLEELQELLLTTKDEFSYIDNYIGELEEQRKKLASEIAELERESKGSSYSLEVFQKTKELNSDLRDIASLISKANQERDKKVTASSSKLVSQLSNIENRWDQESAERFHAKYSPRLDELVDEIIKIKEKWSNEFNQEQQALFDNRAVFKPFISSSHSSALSRYPGGLSLVKMEKFNEIGNKIIL